MDEPILIEESAAPEQVAEAAHCSTKNRSPPKFQPFQIEENMPQSAMLDERAFELPAEPAPVFFGDSPAARFRPSKLPPNRQQTVAERVEPEFELPVQHAAEVASPAATHETAAQPDVADIFSLLNRRSPERKFLPPKWQRRKWQLRTTA